MCDVCPDREYPVIPVPSGCGHAEGHRRAIPAGAHGASAAPAFRQCFRVFLEEPPECEDPALGRRRFSALPQAAGARHVRDTPFRCGLRSLQTALEDVFSDHGGNFATERQIPQEAQYCHLNIFSTV